MDELMMARNRDELSFETMRPEEQMIVESLREAKEMGIDMMHISDLQAVNGWGETEPHFCGGDVLGCPICDEAVQRGCSKVRNNLRRLMRYGWINRPLEGTYALVVEDKVKPPEPEKPVPVLVFDAGPLQPVCPVEIKPPTPVVRAQPLVIIRKKNRDPHPVELNADEALRIRAQVMSGNENAVAEIKHLDCSLYSACLNQALAGSWAGFSCTKCTAYAQPERLQAESDIYSLLALRKANEMLQKFGKVMRVRGVKPGADAKRTIVHDDNQDQDEMAEVG